uniref:Farnesyl pyrophosphate synthase n=1 Tax=Tetropium fuscum TaxID=256650 RepID=J9QQQ8_TETFS|nr:putative farnesyl diphosphate synthase [Tetropium fuscum]
MFPSVKICVNRTSRDILRKFQRHISKTSSVPNSDAISRQQDNTLKVNHDLEAYNRNKSSIKWAKLSRHNNIRALSTIQTKVKPPVTSTPLVSKEESREFMAIFPDIVRDLTDAGRHTDIPEVTKRFAKVLQYNVPTGKKTRGLSCVTAYKILEKPENLTPENVKLANILGWCIELLRGFELIVDDIVDNAETRRNAPCWFRKDNVGYFAIGDSILLESSVYSILRKYFSTLPCYVPMMELVHDVTLKTAMGKSLEGLIMQGGKPNLDKFTMKNYNLMTKYKVGYYTFQLPVALAMYFANMFDAEQHRQAKTILLEMGQFLQIQTDFLDCFGDPAGKIGNDIQAGRCSWLAIVALQRANPAQRKLMEDYYGMPGAQAGQIIKMLYEELSLPATYAAYEEESYNIINTHIQQISKGLPHELFFTLMEKLYRINEYDC